MDIRNVGNQGNVDRIGERSRRDDAKRTESEPTMLRGDDAKISSTGRETAAAVEQLAERARSDDSDREALVEAAKARLLSGELDSAAVYEATARRLSDSGFLS